MGNKVGVVYWNNESQSKEMMIKIKLEELRGIYNLAFDERADMALNHYRNMKEFSNYYAVSISGFSILLYSEANIKSFLYDISQFMIRHNIKFKTTYDFLPP